MSLVGKPLYQLICQVNWRAGSFTGFTSRADKLQVVSSLVSHREHLGTLSSVEKSVETLYYARFPKYMVLVFYEER